MKGYKGFDRNLKCLGMQYEVGKTYEEDEAKLCQKGLHFCEAPLDVLNYYPVVDNDGNINRFCKVEADEVSDEKGGDSKRVAKKLTVGAEMNIFDIAKAHIEYVKSTVDEGNDSKNVGGYCSKNVGGNYSKNVGGNYSKNVGGFDSKNVGGNDSNNVGGNDSNNVGGNCSNNVGGNDSKNVGGYCSKNVGGNYSKNVGGNYSKNVGGKSSIIVASNGSIAKAGLNSVIVLTEWAWVGKELKPIAVCAKIVDGKKIKADTWYRLIDGKFTEVTDDDEE